MIDLEFIPPAYQKYIRWIDDSNIYSLLEKDFRDSSSFFEMIPENKFDYYYAPGKWSIKEVLQHLIDVERVFVYRALRFSRLDPTDLLGFDQELYIETVSLDNIAFKDILNEWKSLRASTILFYKNLNPKFLDRNGRADGHEFSVKSIAYVLVGHTRHHISILKEKYL